MCVCACVLEPVYGSYLWMRRRECCGIFGFGVRNAFYESFMAFNVETPAYSNTLSTPSPHAHTHTHAQGVGATWRLLYAALASHNQRQRVASPEFGLTGVVIKGAENDVKGERREGCAQRELTFTFTAI